MYKEVTPSCPKVSDPPDGTLFRLTTNLEGDVFVKVSVEGTGSNSYSLNLGTMQVTNRYGILLAYPIYNDVLLQQEKM